ncbi:pantetheine-phosphate adenylyltransferase [Oscillospiraceae bacterium Marseille-Q3528]|nr:pantetheine-phosphate adenylyltransferase [Oscillospiraceae bacterium Marseille-Q3528]WNV56650.1 pantetheine-phosphate adenylyltransferase [Oscillospiraceae bacterium NTUH-002-81]
MKKGIYAGSFDPVTYGHIDVIERAARLVDELIVAVLGNSGKTPLFTVEEREDMLREVTKHIPNVTVQSFGGLTVDFARQQHAQVLIRGLRAIPDFEYELNMAQTNHIIAPEIETVFLMTSLKYSYLSSTTVKEVAWYDADIKTFVPPYVEDKIRNKFKNHQKSSEED